MEERDDGIAIPGWIYWKKEKIDSREEISVPGSMLLFK